ncbi:hypothetical protein P378_11595 [Desulforamulus profundi]|uniref:Uncharacterized protein n=1 Tax=Desulforamulus profundi TaxID=1383067 RepID=A0A2C6MEU6_9FIRM|nr:hypothetical protein [Desulforamulus profundi]PHJ38182.1 hypothetical protein P378_11595 [Desulforamulus profundi]
MTPVAGAVRHDSTGQTPKEDMQRTRKQGSYRRPQRPDIMAAGICQPRSMTRGGWPVTLVAMNPRGIPQGRQGIWPTPAVFSSITVTGSGSRPQRQLIMAAGTGCFLFSRALH